MGHPTEQPVPPPHVPERVRRPELIRAAAGRRREFPKREAQTWLQRKETRWAPIAYGVFALALIIIGFFAYSSYAFSKYRGEILPGVQVDNMQLGGLTEAQAVVKITNRLASIGQVPVRLTYSGFSPWKPSADQIGLLYKENATAYQAMQVGRAGSIVQQWFDRLPLHPGHSIPLSYSINEKLLRKYLLGIGMSHNLSRQPVNARLMAPGVGNAYHVQLVHSQPGSRFNLAQAEQAVHDELGSLVIHMRSLQFDKTQPAINDAAAQRVQSRVEAFLAHPPVVAAGKRVIVGSRSEYGPMFSFTDKVAKTGATIVLNVDSNKLHAYVASLAGQVDRTAQDAKLSFDAGQVSVINPQRNGRFMDQNAAYAALLPMVTGLKPNARVHFKVAVTRPPIDQSNPASLGIRQLLGTGVTTFAGSGATRLTDIEAIAKSLNQDLISPTQDISFNTLVGTGWPSRMFVDRVQVVHSQMAPSASGAMQQVATTFLRAFYSAGLRMEERHAHLHRLPWYAPPVGFDAVVAPGRAWDLRFANNTHRYLLIETRVEPIRKALYIYIYGPKLGWHVSVNPQPISKVYPHGASITRQDSSLLPGQSQQVSVATDGADTVVQRTVTYPNGRVSEDEIDTHYQPSSAIINVGTAPTATPTPKTKKSSKAPKATRTPPATSGPGPTPTATFNH
ncbi:MAG: VanW family protein [Chloroflexota bacterium]